MGFASVEVLEVQQLLRELHEEDIPVLFGPSHNKMKCQPTVGFSGDFVVGDGGPSIPDFGIVHA